MIIYRKCANRRCDKLFASKTSRHIFCSRKCFWEHYHEPHFPSFICPNCDQKTQLDFEPKNNRNKWHNWECPSCGYSIKDEFKDFSQIKEIKQNFREEVWIEPGDIEEAGESSENLVEITSIDHHIVIIT